MKIAVESYELYNSGYLLNKWFDTDIDTYEEVEEYVLEAHKKLGFQDDECEMFVADYEDEYNLYRGESVYEAFDITDTISMLGDDDIKKVSYMIDQCNYSLNTAVNKADDCKIYKNTTMNKLAEMFVDDGLFGEIPESIQNYINYDAIARDLSFNYDEYNGDIFRVN